MSSSTRCLRPVRVVCSLSIGLVAWTAISSIALAQIKLQIAAPRVAPPGQATGGVTGGTPLDIDRRLKQSLNLAEQYLAEGKTSEALELWQNALTKAKNTLTTNKEWQVSFSPPERTYTVYRSITDEIERRLAALPPADLRLYRQTYDADAGLILKLNKHERLKALEDVVDQYFISSIGDESAYYLALLWFDQGDYARSARMLQKILTHYPDSTVSPKQIRLRLALISARMRDANTARKYWDEYLELSEGNVPDSIRQMYHQELAQAARPPVPMGSLGTSWPMPFGAPSRNRALPSLPNNALDEKLSESWSEPFETQLEQTKVTTSNNRRTVIFAGGIARTTSASGVPRKPLGEEWRANGWFPSRQMYFEGNRVFLNGNGRVLCVDAERGEPVWKGRKYQYEADPAIRYFAAVGRSTIAGANRPPSTIPEVRLFGDRLHPQMAIHEGTVYALEGRLLDWTDKPGPASNATTNLVLGRRRSRVNWMSAYDASNGKLKWYRSASDEVPDEATLPTSFLAAPVPFAKHLLVPVASKGELWLHALRQDTGETDWKVFLWDEPVEGVSPFSPVGTAIEGGDIYLATGMGIVFALDAATGKVHWAAKYPRKGVFPSANVRGINAAALANATKNGWIEDVVIPHGNHLIVLPSDFDRIIAFDRRTGGLLWDNSQDAEGGLRANYCLGVSGDGLFVAGREVVRRYKASTGKLLWEYPIQNSLGQGALTPDGLFVPTDDAILKLDPETGEEVARADVYTPTGEPVGNLFSDGRHLYGVGLQRVYVLASLTDRLKSLAKRIKDGDGEAQLVRMRIHLQRGNMPEAVDDLKAAVAKIKSRQGAWKSWQALNRGIEELELAEKQPERTLQFFIDSHLTELELYASPTADLSDDERANIEFERSLLIHESLHQIQTKANGEALAIVLKAADLCTTPQLESQVKRTVAEIANEDDRPLLEQSLEHGEVPARLAASEAMLELFKADEEEIAKTLLEDADDRVRLKGASVQANLGRRDILPVLAGLLQSDDVGVRMQSASILRAMTKKNFHFTAYDKPDERAEIVAKWKNWIDTDGRTAELIHPIRFGAELRGLTLVTNYNQGMIMELDKDGDEVWKRTGITTPWSCQGLPNGNRLVTSYRGKSIHEYDPAGKEVWKKDSLPGYPFSVQRLENGNTLVSCSDSRSIHRVIEYTPAGKIAWETNLSGTPRSAQRLDNGNTLIAVYNRHEVVELDPQGKVVWKATNMNSPIKAQRLPSGHTLVVQYNSRQIVELDASGKTVWAKRWNTTLYDAQRLANGNTLIADTSGIHEITADGKTIFEKRLSGVRGLSRY